jgi:NitT/TauT family transport system substrate-binding protein
MIPPTHTRFSEMFRICFLAIGWLALISALHFLVNTERIPSQRVLMGYMPVITNLAAPLVDAASRNNDPRFEAVKFSSFAEMGEAFKSGHIDVAFVIAPLAVAMHQQGVPLKVVYIGNRHESTMVVRKEIEAKSLLDVVGKTIAVPMRYSGHFLAIRRYLRMQGMDAQSIRTVEIPPPDMAPALAAGVIDGYFVGEPFACKSMVNGAGVRLINVEDVWPKFICNLMVVRNDLIRSHPDWVQTLVGAAVKSGYWAEAHPEDAVRTASEYWGQDPNVVRYALTNPPGRIRYDLYLPVIEEMEEVAQEMFKSGLSEQPIDIRNLLDDTFAKAADPGPVDSIEDILK